MKLLIVSGVFPPRKYGGVTTTSFNLAKKLSDRGHDVSVFTTDVGNNPISRLKVNRVQNLDGIQVYYFRNISNRLAFQNNILLPIGFIATLRNNLRNFDLIHLNGLRSLHDVITAYYAKKFHIPYILQAHGSLPRVGSSVAQKWVWDKLFLRKLVTGASKVIALNKIEFNHYRINGIAKNNISIIPNGIDLSTYATLPEKGSFKKKYNIDQNSKIILYLGRVHKTKGIDLLIRAYANLISKFKFTRVYLIIVGPGKSYLDKMEDLSRSLNLSDSILFCGFISSEDKIKALVDADLFVTPCFYGFPVTFLEACATGTPIVTTNLGDTLDWIDENVGYVTSSSHLALSKAIHKIITNEKLREKFSSNCLQEVNSNFSLDTTIAKIEHIYKEVLFNAVLSN